MCRSGPVNQCISIEGVDGDGTKGDLSGCTRVVLVVALRRWTAGLAREGGSWEGALFFSLGGVAGGQAAGFRRVRGSPQRPGQVRGSRPNVAVGGQGGWAMMGGGMWLLLWW